MNSILILGATSDIAQSIAGIYASKKFTVMLAGRSVQALDPIKNDLSIRYETPVSAHQFDAAQSHEQHQQFYASLPVAPAVVVCAFGYLGSQAIAQNDWSEAQNILVSNYTGAVSILNIVANDMEKRKAGQIIGIGSVAGDRGRQSNYLYGSAKAGFSAYLSGLRSRLFKSNVHVMTVKPGFVDTRMTAGMKLPKILTASADHVAGRIFRNSRRNVNSFYVLSVWRWIMLIIRMIPESVFKRLKL